MYVTMYRIDSRITMIFIRGACKTEIGEKNASVSTREYMRITRTHSYF